MDAIYEKINSIISPVYMVGGSVRDAFMGAEPKDYDFITPHGPDVIEQSIRRAGRKPFLQWALPRSRPADSRPGLSIRV